MTDALIEAVHRHVGEIARRHLGRDVAAADVTALLDFVDAVSHEPGDVIFRQNDPASAALFVVEGRLRASIRTAGQDRVIGDSAAGEVVGEAALFRRGGRRTVTLTVVERSTCLVLSRAVFVAAANNPALVALEVHLAHLCAERMVGRIALVRRAWEEAGGEHPVFTGALASLLGAQP